MSRITVTDVADRFEQAWATMRRLPPVKARGYHSTWPAFVREAEELADALDVKISLGPPTAKAIDQMDEVGEWFLWVQGDPAKILWLRAGRVPFRVIARKMGMSEDDAKHVWKTAIIKITRRLNGDGDEIRQ